MSNVRFPARRTGVDPYRLAKGARWRRHGIADKRRAPDLHDLHLRPPSCRAPGFSLAELLIAVALVALLAAIGYPSYIQYKVRANRAAAQSFLIDIANRQHLHFLDARGFTTDLAQLGASPIPPEVAAYYVIAIPVADNSATPPMFLLSAVPRPGTVQAPDGDLGLDSTGARSGHW